MGRPWNVSKKNVLRSSFNDEFFYLGKFILHYRDQPLVRVDFAKRVSSELNLEDHKAFALVFGVKRNSVSASVRLADRETLHLGKLPSDQSLTKVLEAFWP
jgi:hypothetical protein